MAISVAALACICTYALTFALGCCPVAYAAMHAKCLIAH